MEYLTLQEAARKFRRNPEVLRLYIKAGRLRAVQPVPGGRYLIPVDAELQPARRSEPIEMSIDDGLEFD